MELVYGRRGQQMYVLSEKRFLSLVTFGAVLYEIMVQCDRGVTLRVSRGHKRSSRLSSKFLALHR